MAMESIQQVKREVFEANLELFRSGLILYTWGNVSGITEDRKFMVIKPSGVPYEELTEDSMVVVEVKTGESVGKQLRPSSDAETHMELYRTYTSIKGITHTHSKYATAFAQAGCSIPILGTTHADFFKGNIPCTKSLSKEQTEAGYEKNTGVVIVDTLKELGLDACEMPGIIVKHHGPFAWGEDPRDSVRNAVVLETVAEMAYYTIQLNKDSKLPQYIQEKHYERKHGKNAYYGQVQREEKHI